MFFLKDKYTLGYHYGQPTFYKTKHLGQDYICPVGTKVYAPFDGVVTKTFYGTDGGYTTWFKPTGQDVTYRFLHLSKQLILGGSKVKEGDLMAISGNTGAVTTAAHVHFDVFKGSVLPKLVYTNFINPDTINWNSMETFKVVVVDNAHYANMPGQIQQFADYVKTNSNSKLQVVYSLVTTNFTDIPLQTQADGFLIPEQQWMRDNIYQYRGDADALLFITLPLQTVTEQGYMIDPSVSGDPFILFVDTPNTPLFLQENGYTEVTKLSEHELAHCLYHITGGVDQTHFYDYTPGHNLAEAYQTLDYAQLSANLALRRQQRIKEPMLIIHKKSDPNTKFALSSDLKVGFADFPAYQKFTAGHTIIDVELADTEFNKVPASSVVIKS